MVNADSGQAVHSSERSDDRSWSRNPPQDISRIILRLSFLFFFMLGKEVRLWSVWTRSVRPTTWWETRSVRFPQVGRDPQAAAHDRGAPTVADHDLPLLRRVSGSRIVGPFSVSLWAR